MKQVTKEGRDKTYQFVTSQAIPAGDTNTKVIMIGNLLHEDSIIRRFMNEINLKTRDGIYRSYPFLKDGKPLWPEKFTSKASIEALKRKVGNDKIFRREYMLEIVPEDDQVIDLNWIQYYDGLPLLVGNGYRFTAIGVDLAISDRDSADYTAFVSALIFGYGDDMRIYILPNPLNKKMNFSTTEEQMKSLVEALGSKEDVKIYIENVGYQQAFVEVPAEIKLNEEKPVEPNAPAEAVCDNDSLIYSTTHPGTIWRKNNTAVFSWDVGPDVVASRIGFDQNPSGEPSVLNSPAIVEKKYDNVADGVWYFHLSLQNNDGWTKTEHFKIKVDQTAPKITLSEVPRTDLTNPKPVINLKVTDAMSCVKEFTLSIDGQPIDYNKRLDGALELGTVDPGQHELSVVAYDRAGNQNEAFLDIKVSALDTPVVKEYPNEVSNAGEISVKGETIQNANLTAKITTKGNNFVAREDFQSGSGTFTWKPSTKLPRGIVYVSFKVSDSRGASSNFSEPIAIKIGHGVHVNISDLVAKIPPGVAMAGLVIVGIFLVVIITRALTIRRFKREHSDWD
jgi:hypothetical protein